MGKRIFLFLFHYREKVKEIINYHRASAMVFYLCSPLAMAEMLPRQDIDAKVKVSLLYQTQKLNIFVILSSRILHCKNTFIVHVT